MCNNSFWDFEKWLFIKFIKETKQFNCGTCDKIFVISSPCFKKIQNHAAEWIHVAFTVLNERARPFKLLHPQQLLVLWNVNWILEAVSLIGKELEKSPTEQIPLLSFSEGLFQLVFYSPERKTMPCSGSNMLKLPQSLQVDRQEFTVLTLLSTSTSRYILNHFTAWAYSGFFLLSSNECCQIENLSIAGLEKLRTLSAIFTWAHKDFISDLQ